MLYDEDWKWLTQEYGAGGHKSEVGTSRAIRTIVHQRVQGMKAKINQDLDNMKDSQRDTGEPGLSLGDEK